MEAAIAHHQRDYDQLNQVVIEQAKQIIQLQRRVERLELHCKQLDERLPDEDRDLLDDKPPHY